MTDKINEVPEQNFELFRALVQNVVDGQIAELYSREVAYGYKDTAMKGVRQKIRDLGLKVNGDRVTIRHANVENVVNGNTLTKTITFTDAVPSEVKGSVSKTVTTSTARKNAADTVQNETDIEILGIAMDDTVAKEDAHEALIGYPRHQLIHAVNTHRGEDGEKLSHYSTKAQAIEILLALACA